MSQRTLGSGWGVLLPGLLIAGLMYADLSPDQVADCHSDGISIDVGDAVSQTVTALRFATIVPGAYCCHHADDNEFESGMKNQGRNKKGSKDNWCEGGDLNPHVRKDTNT